MECSICYNVIQNSCVGSCMHHFCFPCLTKWCLHGGTGCPLCKTFISQIKFDKEFDLLISKLHSDISFSEITSEIISNYCKRITIESPRNKCVKITLQNYYGPGIKVHALNKKGIAYEAGLRTNDVIIFINNIPCISHNQAIKIVNGCIASNITIDFLLLKE